MHGEEGTQTNVVDAVPFPGKPFKSTVAIDLSGRDFSGNWKQSDSRNMANVKATSELLSSSVGIHDCSMIALIILNRLRLINKKKTFLLEPILSAAIVIKILQNSQLFRTKNITHNAACHGYMQ